MFAIEVWTQSVIRAKLFCISLKNESTINSVIHQLFFINFSKQTISTKSIYLANNLRSSVLLAAGIFITAALCSGVRFDNKLSWRAHCALISPVTTTPSERTSTEGVRVEKVPKVLSVGDPPKN